MATGVSFIVSTQGAHSGIRAVQRRGFDVRCCVRPGRLVPPGLQRVAGSGADARMHWCGRDYESFGGLPRTWKQITVREPAPVHAVGQYPRLGWYARSCSPPPGPGCSGWPLASRRCAQWRSACVPGWTSTGPTALRAAHDTVIQPSPLRRNGSSAIGGMRVRAHAACKPGCGLAPVPLPAHCSVFATSVGVLVVSRYES
jgi:hypothetical protein